MLKSIELTFTIGKEFEEKTFDGRKVRGIVTMEDNKFISIQNNVKEGGISTKIVREFKGDEMIQSSSVIGSDTVCIQVFTRQTSQNWVKIVFETEWCYTKRLIVTFKISNLSFTIFSIYNILDFFRIIKHTAWNIQI